MDDLVGLLLYGLFGVLGIFIIVRIVKAASRTVDQEQKNKQEYPKANARNTTTGAATAPQPSANKPKEIKLGMTPAEVEAALGLPETKIDLGEKLLYKYKDMSVEFKGGKVADVR